MEFTVQNVCGLLIKSKLLTPDGVKSMYDRWVKESGTASGSLTTFIRWLVTHQYVTEYQAALVAKGHHDSFFLNQYKILDRLGRGRTAGVYRAVHNLGQMVAIKILPPSRNQSAQHFGRFQREMKLALKLKHPNVVRSFQVGEANGVHYLVMEFLDGETLDEVLKRRKKLPPQEAVRLIHQAMTGLQHIHEQGLVHRDLKPANLMVVPSSAGKTPDSTAGSTLKILDIGLGRMLQENAEDAVANMHLTGEGVLLGTPDYLAPEQARDPRAVDIRADIYSMGCVLYQCLAGQPPFPDTNILSQMVRHATETPKPLKDLSPGMPDGLQQIVSSMLAKNPADRYSTPERAAQALQAFLAAGTEQPKLPEEGPQLKRFLTWLEMDDKDGAAKPAPKETSERHRPLSDRDATRQAPAPMAQLAVPHRHKEKRYASKKKKKTKSKPNLQIQKSIPLAAPAAAPVAVPVRPGHFDVELVPTAGAAATKTATAGRFQLSNRDWALLGIGAGLVIVAGLVGVLLAGRL